MNPIEEHLLTQTRREFFKRSGVCLGAMSLASLLSQDVRGAQQQRVNPLAPKKPPFAARAKHVIYLHMIGAPSQLDLFDNKPSLVQLDGQPCPEEFIKGKRFAFIRGRPRLLGTRFKFARHGRNETEMSELLPHLAGVADELAVIRSMHTDEFNHGPAQLFLHTGSGRLGRPSFGAWTTYGLGSENQDLPAYVVMTTGAMAGAGTSLWGSGFLPSVYQGIQFRTGAEPVLFLDNPAGQSRDDRRNVLDAVRELNEAELDHVGDPEIATRISQYETAFRMQTSVPELTDISKESPATLDLYGATPGKGSFANNCLLARRLVERGVRVVELFDEGWDHHGAVFTALPKKCKQVDQPIAALIADLRQRGLLDETLVIWGGEFGRTPMQQSNGSNSKKTAPGRDHHKDAYTMWLAGGGAKPGSYGSTDELGYNIDRDPVHVHDLNATILRLLGMDHEKLTYTYQGRAFRLTDVFGKVVEPLLS
ncbi:MAG TPA: DUF1501 domain-containing protein [Tepidisphaeraceae bacterium]|jgi:hypothetical protein|nr:DUF1501 domain-containing protein [Tepidisphaeraceae bacterium]